VTKDGAGALTTQFAPGAPERAAARLGKSITDALDYRADEDGITHLGAVVSHVKGDHPDATTGEVFAALKHMHATRQAEGKALNEVQSLTKPGNGADDSTDPATATLWDRDRAMHYWMKPRGKT
jgi:hypothetical protein